MSDFNPMLDTLARQQIQERVATHRRETLPGPRRPHGRHAWASRLHAIAERLDS